MCKKTSLLWIINYRGNATFQETFFKPCPHYSFRAKLYLPWNVPNILSIYFVYQDFSNVPVGC